MSNGLPSFDTWKGATEPQRPGESILESLIRSMPRVQVEQPETTPESEPMPTHPSRGDFIADSLSTPKAKSGNQGKTRPSEKSNPDADTISSPLRSKKNTAVRMPKVDVSHTKKIAAKAGKDSVTGEGNIISAIRNRATDRSKALTHLAVPLAAAMNRYAHTHPRRFISGLGVAGLVGMAATGTAGEMVSEATGSTAKLFMSDSSNEIIGAIPCNNPLIFAELDTAVQRNILFEVNVLPPEEVKKVNTDENYKPEYQTGVLGDPNDKLTQAIFAQVGDPDITTLTFTETDTQSRKWDQKRPLHPEPFGVINAENVEPIYRYPQAIFKVEGVDVGLCTLDNNALTTENTLGNPVIRINREKIGIVVAANPLNATYEALKSEVDPNGGDTIYTDKELGRINNILIPDENNPEALNPSILNAVMVSALSTVMTEKPCGQSIRELATKTLAEYAQQQLEDTDVIIKQDGGDFVSPSTLYTDGRPEVDFKPNGISLLGGSNFCGNVKTLKPELSTNKEQSSSATPSSTPSSSPTESPK